MRKTRRARDNRQTELAVLIYVTIASAVAAASDASFAPHALALAVFFVALLAITILRLAFGDRWRPPGSGETRLAFAARVVGAIAVIAMPLAVSSFWSEHELTAEKIGREIDRSAAAIGRQAEEMMSNENSRRG